MFKPDFIKEANVQIPQNLVYKEGDPEVKIRETPNEDESSKEI
jgi:hypothetical protein